MQGYRGICAIHRYQSSLCFFVASSLGFDTYSSWTSNTELASSMAFILPHTRFGPKFKHTKGVDIFMGDIYSLSNYPHYWKSSLVPHLLVGNIDCPVQLSQGWIFHQEEFWHS